MLLIDQMNTVNGAPRDGDCEGQGPALSPAHRALTHTTADCLTGGHRRQAGIPPGSSTPAQSHPGPRPSHSTLGSEHPMQPQHPGARSWREEQSGVGVGSHVNSTLHVTPHARAICLSTLTESPRRSSLLRSTPSQSGRGKCCRAGGYLFGRPVPGVNGEGQKGQDSTRGNRGQAQRGSPEASHVIWEACSPRAL